jgi:sarcosine oxidase subunit alpha
MSPSQLTARTPLHHWHSAHGAHFTERDGWQIVTAYSDGKHEIESCRTGLGIADVSSLAKISLRGPGLPSLIEGLVPNPALLSPRRVATILDNILACRLTEDHLLLLASTPTVPVLTERLAGLRIVQTEVTSAYAGFVLLGPRLEPFLRRLTHLDLRSAPVPENSCAETALARVETLLVRSAEFGLLALRLYVAWDLGEYVWERMLEAGHDGPITPIGLDALTQLRANTGAMNNR